MAIELTRARLRSLVSRRAEPLHVPPHVLAGVTAAVVAICLASLLLGIRNAHRDESAARARFADAQALLALPPIDTSALDSRLSGTKSDLAAEEAIAAAVSERVGSST